MTNAMTAALVSAGFPPITLTKRIWLWLHDHPDKTVKEISAALNEKPSHVSTRLSELTQRGMVTRTDVKRRQNVKHGRLKVAEYATAIKEYEVLPMKKPAKQISQAAISVIAKAVALGEASKPHDIRTTVDTPKVDRVITAAMDESATLSPLQINVKALPLGEALRVYGELHAVFGPRA